MALHFRFTEIPTPRWWWLVLSGDVLAATHHDPRLPLLVRVDSTLSSLAGIWLGHSTWLEALQDGTIKLTGEPDSIRAAIALLGTNQYAERSA